jgi:hypothetical protein
LRTYHEKIKDNDDGYEKKHLHHGAALLLLMVPVMISLGDVFSLPP